MLTTIALGLHHAVLDLSSGDGFLILPLRRHDVRLGGESLQEADLEAALGDLGACGWHVTKPGPPGSPLRFQAFTEDGRALLAVVSDHPLSPGLDRAERTRARAEARRAAVLHRCSMTRETDSF